MNCYDTDNNFLGICQCFPKVGEEHYFGDTLYKFVDYKPIRCWMIGIFEKIGGF